MPISKKLLLTFHAYIWQNLIPFKIFYFFKKNTIYKQFLDEHEQASKRPIIQWSWNMLQTNAIILSLNNY